MGRNQFCNDCEFLYAAREGQEKLIFCQKDNTTFTSIGLHQSGSDLLIDESIVNTILNPMTEQMMEICPVVVELNGLMMPSPDLCHKIRREDDEKNTGN